MPQTATSSETAQGPFEDLLSRPALEAAFATAVNLGSRWTQRALAYTAGLAPSERGGFGLDYLGDIVHAYNEYLKGAIQDWALAGYVFYGELDSRQRRARESQSGK